MFKLIYADVTNLSDREFKRLCRSLSTERLIKVQAQKNKDDKYLSVAAGYLLETALNGLGVVNPQICCNEHGKPYLKNSDIYFNISHSGKVAVCAVSSVEVGVDVQQVKPVSDNLIKKVCTQEEYAHVTQSDGGVYQRFCRLWSVKESAIKCLGKGLSLSPSRVSVNLSNPSSVCVDGVEGELYFKEYALSGYCISACSTVDCFVPEIEEVPI